MAKVLMENTATQTDNNPSETCNPVKNSQNRHTNATGVTFLRKHIITFFLLAFILVIVLLIITIINLIKHIDNSIAPISTVNSTKSSVSHSINFEEISGLPNNLTIVTRLEWFAQPPVEPANPLQTPVPYVIIHHTATENCSSQEQCSFHVRFIQRFHIESRNWWDIGYNFLVGGDGKAYEGRGWKSVGACTYGYNAKSIGITFIGTFNSFKPPERQLTACKRLIQKGIELGYIQENYKLLGAKQLQTTQSPGAALYEEIKTWDHWAKAP